MEPFDEAILLLPPELKRVLYLDVDTIVINSLTELETMAFGEAYFMACIHVHKPLAKLNQARLGIEQEVPYINSGVMLLNLPLFREHLDLAEIRAFANKKKSILFLPDQDILTALYGDHVKLLDSLRYNLSDRVLAFHNAKSQQERLDVEWVRKNSVIVHYCGRSKPCICSSGKGNFPVTFRIFFTAPIGNCTVTVSPFDPLLTRMRSIRLL